MSLAQKVLGTVLAFNAIAIATGAKDAYVGDNLTPAGVGPIENVTLGDSTFQIARATDKKLGGGVIADFATTGAAFPVAVITLPGELIGEVVGGVARQMHSQP